MRHWTQDELTAAVAILRASRTLHEGIAGISANVRAIKDPHALANAFARNGMGAPSSHVGADLRPTVPSGPPEPWPAAPVLPNALTRTLIIPDCHVPYHSPQAWATALAAARTMHPENIVVIGDFVDCYSVSRYGKSPARVGNLKQELENAGPMLRELAACATQRRIYTEGNHEVRYEALVAAHAPALFGLLSIRELILHPDDRWEWVPYQQWITVGKMSYSHDVGRSGVNAGRESLREFGGNITFGHSHRGGIAYESTIKGEHRVALNVGWLGDPLKIDYAHRASALRNSQHGFGWVVQDAAGMSWANFIPIINGTCIVDGQYIRAQ